MHLRQANFTIAPNFSVEDNIYKTVNKKTPENVTVLLLVLLLSEEWIHFIPWQHFEVDAQVL